MPQRTTDDRFEDRGVVTIRMPRTVHEAVMAAAADQRKSMNQWAVELFRREASAENPEDSKWLSHFKHEWMQNEHDRCASERSAGLANSTINLLERRWELIQRLVAKFLATSSSIDFREAMRFAISTTYPGICEPNQQS